MTQEKMNSALPPYQALSALPSGNPAEREYAQVWKFRLDLACSTLEMTHAEAQAHVMLQQRQCCVVREGARGRRGGRGKLHYNLSPEWPKEWSPNRFNRYFAVFALTPEYEQRLAKQQHLQEKAEHLALMYGTGRQAGKATQQAMANSIRTGTGVMEVGRVDGFRFIESPYQLPEPEPDAVQAAPPRPRAEWWNK